MDDEPDLVRSRERVEHGEEVGAGHVGRRRGTGNPRRKPDAVAVERVLFQVNARTAMSVGQASGSPWRPRGGGLPAPSTARTR